MRDTTLNELARLGEDASEGDAAFHMDEEAFRGFYDRTARPLWRYLWKVTGDRHQADDLLQETYYRFLRAARSYDTEAHRRNSLFHIATNLVRDARRRAVWTLPIEETIDPAPADVADRAASTTDVQRALQHLKPRERMMLWLAYAQGESHRDIADILGVKTASIKLLLFRARRRLAARLRPDAAAGAGSSSADESTTRRGGQR